MAVYQHINGTQWRNIWVAGDLHGCYSLLMDKLSGIGFSWQEDLLLSVGDLTDRGSENLPCLELLNQPWFQAIRGNHEEMMLDALHRGGNTSLWLINGGDWYFRLAGEDQQRVRSLLRQVAALPLILEVRSQNKRYVICHADYPADHYAMDKPIDEEKVVWSRERITAAQRGRSQHISGAEGFIFGHTPLSTPLHIANQHYIDTGAVFNGHLTLMQIQGNQDERG